MGLDHSLVGEPSEPQERSWEWRKPVFHPAPQPKLPDKGGAPPPMLYQGPEQDI